MLPKRLNSYMAYNWLSVAVGTKAALNMIGLGNSWGCGNRFGGNSGLNLDRTGFVGGNVFGNTFYNTNMIGPGNSVNSQQTQGAEGDDYKALVSYTKSLESLVEDKKLVFFKKYGEWPEASGRASDRKDLINKYEEQQKSLKNDLVKDCTDKDAKTENVNLNSYLKAQNKYNSLTGTQSAYQAKMNTVNNTVASAGGKVEPDSSNPGHYKGVEVEENTSETWTNQSIAGRINSLVDEANSMLTKAGVNSAEQLNSSVIEARKAMESAGEKTVTNGSDGKPGMTAAQYTSQMKSISAYLDNLNGKSPVNTPGADETEENATGVSQYDKDKAVLVELIGRYEAAQETVNKQDAVYKAESDVSDAEAYVKDAKKGHKKHKFARWWHDWTHKDSKDKLIIAAKGELANSQNVLTQKQDDLDNMIIKNRLASSYGTSIFYDGDVT